MTLPSGIVSGNLLVLTTRTSQGNLTPSIGWITLSTATVGGQYSGVYYRVADGSEGATTTFTTSGNAITSGIAYQISGFSQIEASYAASNTVDPPALSPSWDQAKTLWIAFIDGARADWGVASVPTSYANSLIASSGNASSAYVAVSTATRNLDASSDNPSTFVTNGSALDTPRAGLIAIAPAILPAIGTLTNMNRATTPTIGKLGQALNFRGSVYEDRVGADSVTANIDVTDFSVSFWEKTTSSDWGTPFSFGSSTDTDPLVQFVVNVAYPGDGMLFCFRDNVTSGNPECARDSSTVYKDGAWHHFTGTRLGNIVTIYRDGALIQQVTLTGVGIGPISVNKTTIGTLGRAYDQLFFNGTLDDVRIYNRVLSAAEITSLYNSGR